MANSTRGITRLDRFIISNSARVTVKVSAEPIDRERERVGRKTRVAKHVPSFIPESNCSIRLSIACLTDRDYGNRNVHELPHAGADVHVR